MSNTIVFIFDRDFDAGNLHRTPLDFSRCGRVLAIYRGPLTVHGFMAHSAEGTSRSVIAGSCTRGLVQSASVLQGRWQVAAPRVGKNHDGAYTHIAHEDAPESVIHASWCCLSPGY